MREPIPGRLQSSNSMAPRPLLKRIEFLILENEQVHFVRPLPDGGFEIVAGAEATSFLEIVEEDSSRSGDASNNSNLMDSAQIIITQDEDGHLMLEGSPLQYLLGTNNQQPLQFVLNNSMRK